MTKRQRATLRRILAYSISAAKGYSGYATQCYGVCDIDDRAEIDRLTIAIAKVFEPRPAAPHVRGLNRPTLFR